MRKARTLRSGECGPFAFCSNAAGEVTLPALVLVRSVAEPRQGEVQGVVAVETLAPVERVALRAKTLSAVAVALSLGEHVQVDHVEFLVEGVVVGHGSI